MNTTSVVQKRHLSNDKIDDVEDKKEQLLAELKKYEEKLLQIRKDCNDFKAGGSRYGDEYGEIQSKVYSEMIATVREELKKLERKS